MERFSEWTRAEKTLTNIGKGLQGPKSRFHVRTKETLGMEPGRNRTEGASDETSY
jgi:hypothetical protein